MCARGILKRTDEFVGCFSEDSGFQVAAVKRGKDSRTKRWI